mgnify:CR=1 FL=1|tara:strand:- start:1817 stop:2917 length:1101 start_codon:yes stop_codon:yes gene_type:complete
MKKFIKILAFSIIITFYFLVLTVAYYEGPLISFQSLILGILGMISITLGASAFAKKINLVDSPDNQRRFHKGVVPLVGGSSLFISIVYGAFIFGVDPFYKTLIISLIPILIVSILDDLKGMPITYRLVGQILASWIVIIMTDIYLRDLGNLFGTGIIDLGALGIPFTIFAVVGICNAFNMIDGKDGIAGTIALIIFVLISILFFLDSNFYKWGFILIMSLLVFLSFNLGLLGKKRKVFLGDHGSITLGHIVGWTMIYLSQDQGLIKPVTALWFVFLPLTDALLTFFRRIRLSSSIFHSDTQHFHHFLARKNLSDPAILIVIFAISLLTGIVAILGNINDLSEVNLFFGYLTVLIILILLGSNRKKN